MRLPLTLTVLLLAAQPAAAGLIGQSVTLGGVTATIGQGVEFSGTISGAFSRPYTVDFSDAGVTITLDNVTGLPPGGLLTYQFGLPFTFSFADPILAGIAYLGGDFIAPVVPAPPAGCPPLPPGFYYACTVMVGPPQQSTLAVAATGIDMLLVGGIPTGPTSIANFSVQTVPEPATAALLATSMLGLGLLARRRR
ncbi:MAG: PEP-CTERM sorting domain-containing protein [Acetobacteraceae bacterium]|nr:PEP-CTERM sorting domain-containing protein [Acetobacteraceae bacterium]